MLLRLWLVSNGSSCVEKLVIKVCVSVCIVIPIVSRKLILLIVLIASVLIIGCFVLCACCQVSKGHVLDRPDHLLMLSLMIIRERGYYIGRNLWTQKLQKHSVTLLSFHLDLNDVSNIKVRVKSFYRLLIIYYSAHSDI